MQPLKRIPVVGLEQAIAAPFCTRQSADLGARVIKVERPEVNIWVRALAYFAGVAAHLFNGRCN
jgi:itaconate CoA-transferase